MQTEMLTQMDIQKEKFNNQDFRKNVENDPDKFLFFYALLLQFASALNIISKPQQEAIVNNLTQAINRLTGTKAHIIGNYLYIITLYLQSKSNWNAWKELEKLQDSKSCDDFLQNVSLWFMKKVHKMEKKILLAQKDIYSFENAELVKDLTYLTNSVKELKSYDSKSTRLSLKREHSSQILVEYTFLKPIVASNYIERLELTIESFIKETSILHKIDAKNILQQQNINVEKATASIDERYELLSKFLDEDLKKLKEEYDKRTAMIDEQFFLMDEKTRKLEKIFKKDHPGLTKDELEEAFEDYLDTIPEEFEEFEIEDQNKLDQWYSESKSALVQKFEKAEKELDNEAFDSIFNSQSIEGNSLASIIKEFALFSLANKQKISYPQTLAEKNIMLMRLSIEVALLEFLPAYKEKLNDADIKYLQRAI